MPRRHRHRHNSRPPAGSPAPDGDTARAAYSAGRTSTITCSGDNGGMSSTLTNADLAGALEEYAALLELSGANSYATRAYRRAGGLIRGTPADVAKLIRERRVRSLRGVAAGDPRRWKDTPAALVVAVATDAPDGVRARFAALPEVVALVEPSVGVTVDGTPVELVTAPPAEFGTALVCATGSPDYVAGLEPLPAAP